MASKKKNRVNKVHLKEFRRSGNSFALVTLYDIKGREILSSVNCAFNVDYYSTENIVNIAANM